MLGATMEAPAVLKGADPGGTVTSLPPRLDPRYVDSNDSRAVLVARGGLTGEIDAGGWTDGDKDAFLAAIQDEARCGGAELTHVKIERVAR